MKLKKISLERLIFRIENGSKSLFYIVIIIAATLFFLVAISFIVIAILFRNEIDFSPSEYINKGMEYYITAFLVFFSFLLTDVYWMRRVQNENSEKFKTQFLYFLKQGADLSWLTNELLDSRTSIPDQSITTLSEILTNLKRFSDIDENTHELISLWTIQSIKDEKFLASISFFEMAISNEYRDLSLYDAVLPNQGEIRQKLIVIGTHIQKTIDFLGGKINDLN